LVLEDGSPLFQQARDQAGEEADAIIPVDSYTAALEGGYMVAVDGAITPELAEEGLARELVHRIQNLRRSANFEVTDRIVTFYQGPDEFARVMEGSFASYIRDETLSERLVDGPLLDQGAVDQGAGEGAALETFKIEGKEITLGVLRV
jgi:isoleucyl-tRNA synthetase